jgi:tripartite-type tricarboxylate transporter receptor subunit TctC
VVQRISPEDIMAELTRRSLLAAAVLSPLAAQAQSAWPSGTIRIVVPFPAGGSVDTISRLVQTGLQQRLGTNVIVENRPGASGSTGSGAAAKSPPDGSTWLMVFDTHAVNPFLLPNMPFDTEKDLDPVLLIGTAPNVICTHPSRPWRSLADVIAAAKQKPDTITYGSVGTGSIGHLSMTLLAKRAGIRLVHVPYRGGGPLLNDTIAGHVDLSCASTGLLGPHLSGGKTRPLCHGGRARLPGFPDLPTVIEEGFPGFESYAWWGLFAPSGTPKPIIDRFGAEFIAAIHEERVEKQVADVQMVTLTLGGPEVLRRFLADQMRVWSEVIRENNIRGDI